VRAELVAVEAGGVPLGRPAGLFVAGAAVAGAAVAGAAVADGAPGDALGDALGDTLGVPAAVTLGNAAALAAGSDDTTPLDEAAARACSCGAAEEPARNPTKATTHSATPEAA
jgi:hypothetical protein